MKKLLMLFPWYRRKKAKEALETAKDVVSILFPPDTDFEELARKMSKANLSGADLSGSNWACLGDINPFSIKANLSGANLSPPEHGPKPSTSFRLKS
jgi:hypothetical protein